MKKISALLLTVFLIFTLTACESKENATDDKSNNSDSSSAAQENEVQTENNEESSKNDTVDVDPNEEILKTGAACEDFYIMDSNGIVIMDYSDVKEVQYIKNAEQKYDIKFIFNEQGKQTFADVTAANIGKSLSICVGSQLLSSPTVDSAITGGIAIISDLNDTEEIFELITK